MIKVLQIVGNLNYGGVEAVIMNYYRHINKNLIQFDFITTSENGRFEDEIRAAGGGIFHLPSKSKHPFKYMKNLRKIIETNHYDIVHSNTNSASAYLDLRPAKKAGCKVRIAHSHNTSCLVKWQHKLFKPLLPSVTTHRFACSEPAAKWLFGKNNDYVIINNGIDFEKFAFNKETRLLVRDKFAWNDCFIIGNVASFQERKNQRFLISILPEIANSVPNVKLVFVGIGETMCELRELVDELGISERVEFLESRNDVNELLQGFDVFCFPSLFEGLAVAYIEAIASGLPVIISDGVPIVEIANRVKQLPLEKDLWIKNIVESFNNPIDRKLNIDYIEKSGYDIKTLTEKLQNYYVDMVK